MGVILHVPDTLPSRTVSSAKIRAQKEGRVMLRYILVVVAVIVLGRTATYRSEKHCVCCFFRRNQLISSCRRAWPISTTEKNLSTQFKNVSANRQPHTPLALTHRPPLPRPSRARARTHAPPLEFALWTRVWGAPQRFRPRAGGRGARARLPFVLARDQRHARARWRPSGGAATRLILLISHLPCLICEPAATIQPRHTGI